LAALTFDPRRLALQRRQPRDRDQPLVIQILDSRKFPCDQFQLLRLGCDLGIEASDLLAELRDTALQKILLAVTRARASLELRVLGHQKIVDRTVVQPPRQFGRNFGLRQAVALGNQSGDPRPGFIELLAHHLKAGLRLGRVETQQQIADGDAHAIVDRNLRHNPAGRMLDGLDVGLNHQITGNHDRTCQRNQRHPATAHNEANEQHPKADPQLALERAPGPHRQGITRRVIVVGQAVAIDQEGNACTNANAAFLDQLAKSRLGFSRFGFDIADRTRKSQLRLTHRFHRCRRRAGQSGLIDRRRRPFVVRSTKLGRGLQQIHRDGVVERDDATARRRLEIRFDRTFASAPGWGRAIDSPGLGSGIDSPGRRSSIATSSRGSGIDAFGRGSGTPGRRGRVESQLLETDRNGPLHLAFLLLWRACPLTPGRRRT
jgi:hypothetical protein